MVKDYLKNVVPLVKTFSMVTATLKMTIKRKTFILYAFRKINHRLPDGISSGLFFCIKDKFLKTCFHLKKTE